jgi:telomere length regulation protein
MLVAEVVSERTMVESGTDLEYSEKQEIEELRAGLEGDDTAASGKPRGAKRLKFGAAMWDGHSEGKDEARWLRSSIGTRDNAATLSEKHQLWYLGWDKPTPVSLELVSAPVLGKPEPVRGRSPGRTRPKSPKRPKIIMLDDEQLEDTLEGYDPPSPSSRSPSPTPSYLEEIAADPSLALDGQQKKKIKRPVYISQLLQLVKNREKPDSLETALQFGEGLVRAKRSFGGELGKRDGRYTRVRH